jgi:hypothetical protein
MQNIILVNRATKEYQNVIPAALFQSCALSILLNSASFTIKTAENTTAKRVVAGHFYFGMRGLAERD